MVQAPQAGPMQEVGKKDCKQTNLLEFASNKTEREAQR